MFYSCKSDGDPAVAFKVSQHREMLGVTLQRDWDVPSTCLSHISLAVVTHSDGGDTGPSICTPLKQESHIPALLLNGGYRSQLLLLAQGLTRLLITSTASYCSALDEYQLERWHNLRNERSEQWGTGFVVLGRGCQKNITWGASSSRQP